MKRSMGFVAAISLVFLVSSCILNEKDNREKKKIVFRSTDGGESWEDISKGLPENLQQDSIRFNTLFANDKGLFLKAGKELYHTLPNASRPFWNKEVISNDHAAKPGTFTYRYWGVNVKKSNGKSVWSPMFENNQEPRVRSVFETAAGDIFIGTNSGFFKTTDDGSTWKQVFAGGLVGNMAEANGVLLSTSMGKIIRSTDNGENWEYATSEDSVSWDVKPIEDGFAALTSTSETATRRLSTSYDGGKTWQSIHSRLQGKDDIESIRRNWDNRPRLQRSQSPVMQVGDNLFCPHPDGVLKSSDKGKTWKLLLPAIKNKVFNLFYSGNVIYVVAGKPGC